MTVFSQDQACSSHLWTTVFAVIAFLIAAEAGSLGSAAKEPTQWQDVSGQIQELVEAEWTRADRLFAAQRAHASDPNKVNALGVTTTQDASGGCDGVKNGRFGFHVAVGEQDPWWQVDLGREFSLDRIVIHNRTDGGHAPRTRNLRLLIASDARPEKFNSIYQHDGTVFFGAKQKKPLIVDLTRKNMSARYVRVFVAGICHLALDEIEVFSTEDPSKNIALGRPADQKSVSRHSVPGTAGESNAILPSDGGFLLAHTRDVLERATKLAMRLRDAEPDRIQPLIQTIQEQNQRLDRLEHKQPVSRAVRKELYFTARRLARAIAFANPLLDFDDILFIKRQHPNYQHICDQYYGFTSIPGGGLMVLSDAFGERPKVKNLLAHSLVQNGRFQGKPLVPGSFLSPELSFDGNTILFAYTENLDPETSWRDAEKNRTWTTTNCYHLFQVAADGSNLMQLTDGPWDDFDPCFLPNGRIAFISERRGGYVRCGTRACRSYNLCSMKHDGSDIIVLSHHDTNEWHPSVNNDGKIVYTRWDYIDRDTQAAHHLWTCFPDGRDPRAPHGNYPLHLADRPWAELDIRAIPNSPRYVAVAAPHHGHAFGSLILIDPRLRDDSRNSQVFRLTPEVPFPEGEGPIRSSMVYGTPWPLSEDDFLCAYDSAATNHGIYWVDRFGNRELIYRDSDIPCFNPVPLRPRGMPPRLPDQTTQTAAAQQDPDIDHTSTVAVTNIYDSDFEWPNGTRISELRVLQILPKSTPRRNVPKIGVAEQSNARAVLGTVPVERDGSVYFKVPAGRLIYFQALDEQGMAVQSMRSATYVHPGEHLTCQGCHEPTHHTPSPTGKTPLALQRAPSTIQTDVDGSNPFNYVRLVQGVLDRNCVECHKERNAMDLTGTIVHLRDRDGRDWPYTKSYINLAEEYGFWFQTLVNSLNMEGPHGGSRVVPGASGARASKLRNYLDERHYGVKLSDEDFHRVVLWLDCNSEFLGAYENPEAQAQGQPVRPSLN